MNAYQTELKRLLELSTLTRDTYCPGPAMKQAHHSAVFLDEDPFLLCGPADDRASTDMAERLAATEMLAVALKPYSETKHISAGIVSGAVVPWRDEHAVVISNPSGQTEDGVGAGEIMTMFVDDCGDGFVSLMCINTELAQAIDPDAPALDDGSHLASLARACA